MPELGEEREGAAGHLGECEACAAGFSAHSQLGQGLQRLAADRARMQAPGRVETRLVSEFRRSAGVAPATPLARRWKLAFACGGGVALVAAAALLLAVREHALAPARQAAETEIAANDWGARFPEDSGGASEFIPLPNAARLAPSDDVNLVRMEVPRSAMIAVGYVVPPDRADERVQADVVLGSDGLARAVRFLNE